MTLIRGRGDLAQEGLQYNCLVLIMRISLLIMIAFVALTATVSGMLLTAYPDGSAFGLPLTLLKKTFFTDFLIPGIILTIVGIINLAAIFFIFQKNRNKYNWSLAAGILISGWIQTEVIMIRGIHWLHFVYFFCGVLIILVSCQLKSKLIV